MITTNIHCVTDIKIEGRTLNSENGPFNVQEVNFITVSGEVVRITAFMATKEDIETHRKLFFGS